LEAAFLSCARTVFRSGHCLDEADKGLKIRIPDCCVDIVIIDDIEPVSRLTLVGVDDSGAVLRDFVESFHLECVFCGHTANC